MTDAREKLMLRHTLHKHLPPAELRAINWTAVTDAATDAIAQGWEGDDLARWVIGDLGPDADNPGAVIVTSLRWLGQQPPPGHTPQPEPYDDTERQRRIANAATPEQRTHWVNQIRNTINNSTTKLATRK